MNTALLIIHIILAVTIVTTVLLQSQGSGFAIGMSGGGETYHTRRGLEKVVFYLTAVSVGLFILSSIGLLVL